MNIEEFWRRKIATAEKSLVAATLSDKISFAKSIGADPQNVHIDTVFFFSECFRAAIESPPPFVRFSNLVKKGEVIILRDPP